MKSFTTALSLSMLLCAAPASAQWMKHPDPVVPRTRDGKVNLAARAPKARDGKVDLSGTWQPDKDPLGKPEGVENEINPRYFINITADMKPEEVPFQPWARSLFMQRLASEGKEDPITRCQPTGTPAIGTIPLPYKIVQTPRLIVILYEENTVFRQIFLDGRQLPRDAEPRWMGYSVGRWEGDTLVVDTTGLNERSWLDRMGHPHSDTLHVIERFRRRDAGHLDIEVTIDDPKAYTKPITYTQRQTLLPDEDLLEYFCAENEKDTAHFK
jgi:hypothetical protein